MGDETINLLTKSYLNEYEQTLTKYAEIFKFTWSREKWSGITNDTTFKIIFYAIL
jgi:hypothetical protein